MERGGVGWDVMRGKVAEVLTALLNYPMEGTPLGWPHGPCLLGWPIGPDPGLVSHQQNAAKVMDATSVFWLQKIVASVLPVSSFYCLLGLQPSMSERLCRRHVCGKGLKAA